MPLSWEWNAVSVHQQESFSTSNTYISPNWSYGLQEAFATGDGYIDAPFGGYSTLVDYLNKPSQQDSAANYVLFDNACPQNNCINTCESDFTTIFQPNQSNGLKILHNCNLLPNVAVWEFESNKSSDSIAAVSGVFPLNTNLTSTAIKYINTILGCLKGVCDSITSCAQEDYTFPELTSLNATSIQNLTGSDTFYLEDVIESICYANSANQVNVDLGGIGVYASYWIQSGLAFLGFLVTVFWILLVPYIWFCVLAFRHGHEVAWKQLEVARSRVRRQGSPLIAALIELHKSQCFFMLATNIAATVVGMRGGLDPQSLQSLLESYNFIYVIALNGILPITFTMFNLHLFDMMDWYLIVLSCLTILLSIITLILSGRFVISQSDIQNLGQLASQGGPDTCGGLKPQVYCADSYWYEERDLGEFRFVLSFCMLVLVLVTISKSGIEQWKVYRRGSAWSLWLLDLLCTRQDRFLHRQRCRGVKCYVSRLAASSFKRIESIFPRRFINSIAILLTGSPTHDQAASTGHIWNCFAPICYTVIFIVYIVLFRRLLGDLVNYDVSQEWNFGQIVALTVWLPPLFELTHLEIRGMKKGFKHRLLSPYRVTAEPPSKGESSGNEENRVNIAPVGSNEELSLQLISNSQAPGTDHRHPRAGEETMGSQYHCEGTSTEYYPGYGMNYRSERGRSESPMHLATEPADWLSPETGPRSRSWTVPQENPFP